MSKNGIYTAHTALGDGVVVRTSLTECPAMKLTMPQIYRCYMVWRKIWVIVLPMILWCSVLGSFLIDTPRGKDTYAYCLSKASGIGTVYTIAQVTPESGNIFAANTARWITAFYATTLACNFMATGKPTHLACH